MLSDYADRLRTAIALLQELLATTELNMDDMELATRISIAEANEFISYCQKNHYV